MPQRSETPTVTGEIIGESPLRVWSLPSAERLQRQLRRAGAAAPTGNAARRVLLRADWVFDEALVRNLVRRAEDCAVFSDDGHCVAMSVGVARREAAAAQLSQGKSLDGLQRLTPDTLAGSYNDALRKREPPFLLPLRADNLRAVEARVFAGSYKGVTDFVTLYWWPRPARTFTRWCAHLRISPNMVTSASLVLVLLAMWAFWQGHYFWGLAAAWPMTFLDTVDGKLARVTLQSSPWGNVFDHSIDLIHPPFWWWAWIVGLNCVALPLDQPALVLSIIVAGYILQRLEEGLFIQMFKMDIHVWQRFDSALRLVTARRNPNLVIVTVATLFGRPDLGIEIVAVWVVACLLLHGVRLVQAAVARRNGPLRSWLS